MKSVVLVVACSLAFGEALPVSNDDRVQDQPPGGSITIRKEGPINLVFSMNDETHNEIIDPESNGKSLVYKLYPKKHIEETISEDLFVPLKEYQKESRDAVAKANGRSSVHDEIIDVEFDSEGFPYELYPKKNHKETHTQVLFVPLNEDIDNLHDLAAKTNEKSQVKDEIINVEPIGEGYAYGPYPKDRGEGISLEEFFAHKEDSSEEVRRGVPKETEKSKVRDEIISAAVYREDFPFLHFPEDKDEGTRPEDVFVPKEDSSEETLAVATEEDRNRDLQVVLDSVKKVLPRNTNKRPSSKSDVPLRGIADSVDGKSEECLLLMVEKNERKESFNLKEAHESVHGGEAIVVMSPRDYIIPVTIPGMVNYSELRLVSPLYSPPEMTVMIPQGKSVEPSQRISFSGVFQPEEVYPEKHEVRYEEEIFTRDFQPVEAETEESDEEYEVGSEGSKSVEVDPSEESEKESQENVSGQTHLSVLRVNGDVIYPMEINFEESEKKSEEKGIQRQPFNHFYSSGESNEDYYYVVEDDSAPDSFLPLTLSQESEDSQYVTFDYSQADDVLDMGRLPFLSRPIRKEFERSYPSKALRSRIHPLPLRRESKHFLSRRPRLHPVHF